MNPSPSVHPDCIDLDEETDMALRQPSITDDEFPERLRPYLRIKNVKPPYGEP
jgi:hypothetical protein